MKLLIAYVALGLLTLLGIALLKAYLHIPPRELKRRARRGDELAKLLFGAASYGSSLELFLWGVIGLSATGFLLVIDRAVPVWVAIFGSLALLWIGFAWLPNTPVSKPTMRLARWLARPLAALLQRLYPVLNYLVVKTSRWRLSFHTGLYEKEDLLDLLDAQAQQADSRISLETLNLVRNSLTFSDKIVRDIMVPRRQARTVSADETVGPILVTELHDSGQDSFAVKTGPKSKTVVGILHLRDLVEAKKGGMVKDVMSTAVEHLDDELPLDQALLIFLKTKQQLMVVVNGMGDWTGVLSLADLLVQIVGQPVVMQLPEAVEQSETLDAASEKTEEDGKIG